MKYRLSLMDEQNPSDDDFKLPGRKKSKDGEPTLNMYDPDIKCCYDKIDISGLTPFDYKELIMSHLKLRLLQKNNQSDFFGNGAELN